MTGLEIGLLVIGVVLFAASFLVTKRLSPSDIDELKKMSETEIRILMDKGIRDASTQMDDAIEEKIKDASEKFDVETDKETNEKILQISEYSDTVLDSMNKSHDEVMFMYSMLNDKQEKITELTKNMQEMESTLRYMKDAIEQQLRIMEEEKIKLTIPEPSEIPASPTETVLSIQEELQKKYDEDGSLTEEVQVVSGIEAAGGSATGEQNKNDAIIDLHKQGYSEVDIAKKLGRQLVEVKLVLGLFK